MSLFFCGFFYRDLKILTFDLDMFKNIKSKQYMQQVADLFIGVEVLSPFYMNGL